MVRGTSIAQMQFKKEPGDEEKYRVLKVRNEVGEEEQGFQ